VGTGFKIKYFKEHPMVKLINKNGIEIHNSAKHVFEELMRGTGCIMADKSSIFIESESFNEKYIVVSRVPQSKNSEMTKKFASSQFKEAWEVFNNWPEAG
jgi:hypothetical protein